MEPSRILLIDDDVELASLMDEFFTGHGYALKAVYDGPSGLQEALSGAYDLVLLDVMMPGYDGFEVLRRLREQSRLPVIMLTARTESQSRILGLEAGADDYLPKPFEPLELLARIHAVLRRTRPGEPARAIVLDISGVRLDPNARRVSHLGEDVEMTTVEYDILETLMRSAGRPVSRDELMQRLYQREATPFDRSIDVHISHLRRKFGSRSGLIRTVRGSGYQFVIEETTVGR
ncbi:MAG TPA: response regulator transcription factor [Bryobacteraceae bacterium]|nr:response regulator transcription factor [Bryobacteraceae bacterium]